MVAEIAVDVLLLFKGEGSQAVVTVLSLRNSVLHTSHVLPKSFSIKSLSISVKASKMEGEEITVKEEMASTERKKIFVPGAPGNTGKRIVEQLLARGFPVKAGVRDFEKAKTSLVENPALQIADVMEGPTKLVEAIGDDTKAVICATGFRRSWDLRIELACVL